MQLKKLLADLTLKEVTGPLNIDIEHIVFDSRRVLPGSLFVAVRGTQVDGHDFIAQAIAQGAVAVVAESAVEETTATTVTWITVQHSAKTLGHLAAAWYEHPSRALKLVGVTGTNGKTTCVTLLHDLFTGLGYRAGMLSTVEIRIGHQRLPATHTTPDALTIQQSMARMREAGCDYAFMEVSSHAVDQDRTAGLHFTGGVFTNMSHDHLDYHGSFQAYIEAKKKFFDKLTANAFALVNVDDKRGPIMVQNTAARVYRYSLRTVADFRARLLASSPQGMQVEIDRHEVHLQMLGEYNAYNMLAVYGAARLLQQDTAEVLTVLSALRGAEGRMEYVTDERQHITAIVDYAHTPDALEKVLTALRALRPVGARIITVVGAGGDRDRTKRPEMAAVSLQLADQLILTSDNPRSEDPEAILDDMEAGVPPADRGRMLRIADRSSAIRAAVQLARVGDLILVAGKGHEKYQEVKGQRLPFDDKEILQAALRGA